MAGRGLARLVTTDSGARTNEMLADVSRRGAEILDTATPAGARLDQMRRFFVQLSDNMAGGTTAAVFSDTLTALAHAVTPRTVDQPAHALGWPPERVADALDSAERHPDIADPVALRYDETGACTVTTRAGRLTPAQLAALGHP
ncbi:hypothetical protein ACFXKX_29260 [Streptomyces scopuliridis]|uniref:hypothetical protein n=1 Tax=Streptomyces scopuliridis TaxID=452529 RepID=UPI003689847B